MIRWTTRLRHLLRDVLRRRDFERDMDAELEAFLDMVAEDRLEQGSTPDEAKRAARMQLGGVEQAREAIRAERLGGFLDTLGQDLRYALRRMRRQAGFTVVAVATVALGIGASTAVLSTVRSVLLAPLPFRDSERLVRLLIVGTDADGRRREASLVPSWFHALRERSRVLERVAAQRYQDLTLSGDGEPERVVAIGVSDQWAETLGVQPALGRGFSPDEQRAGSGGRVALLGYGFWRRRYGGDPSVLGRSLRLNDRSYTAIGVMPPQFRYPYNADVWIPMTFPPERSAPADLNAPARLRKGVSLPELNRELAEIGADLSRELPLGRDFVLAGKPMDVEFARDPHRSVAALAAAVGVVLLLACVNLATLLLARGASRSPELALRAALGAGRGRQIRQLLTESLVLALAGGLAGVVLARLSSDWLGRFIPPRLGEVFQEVRVDGIVLGVSLLVCGATGVAFGLLPALRQSATGPAEAIRRGGRTGRGGAGRALGLLVVGEVALSAVLLVAAVSMVRNFARLVATDVGYDPAGLTRVRIGLPETAYADPARRASVVAQIADRVRAVPGVAAAGVTMIQPVPRTRANIGTSLVPDTEIDPAAPPPIVNRRLVTPGYFEAVGLALERGRGFDRRDREATAPVVIVSRSAARRFWPRSDPVGRRVRLGSDEAHAWHTVVGVVSDVLEPYAEIGDTVYEPYAQATSTLPPGAWWTTSVSLMVRATGGDPGFLPRVRRAVWAVDPTLPLFDVAAMSDAIAEPLSDQRLGATLFASFGAFALLMAVLGTYGVLAFAVSRRVPEYGVRLALGAQRVRVLGGVLASGLRLVSAGLIVGMAGSLVLSRALDGFVSEVSSRDPLTLGGVALVLLAAGLAACGLPALRATRVDPVVALRAE
jgi:putative ABC transport system permease protein